MYLKSGYNTKMDLETILAKKPFYQSNIAEYDITEFVPSMVAKGFENLQE